MTPHKNEWELGVYTAQQRGGKDYIAWGVQKRKRGGGVWPEQSPKSVMFNSNRTINSHYPFPWDGEGIWTCSYGGELIRLPSSDQEEKEGGGWGGGDAVDKSWSKRESICQR